MLTVTLLQFGNDILIKQEVYSGITAAVLKAGIGILTFFVNYLAASVLTGMIIRLVTELFLAPLRPVKLRTAFAALKKRFWPLLLTGAMASITSFLGLILCVIPGLVLFTKYSLYSPVVIMENLKGRAALKRSSTLVKRSVRTVVGTLLIQWLVPFLTSIITVSVLIILLKGAEMPNRQEIAGRITGIIAVVLNTFLIPLIATTNALLYLKTRRIGGETLREVLDKFEEENAPRTKWQTRIRERLQLKTPSTHA
jgi:hypothetical protein